MEMKTVTKKMAITFRLMMKIKIVTMTKWHDVDDDGNIVTMKMTMAMTMSMSMIMKMVTAMTLANALVKILWCRTVVMMVVMKIQIEKEILHDAGL